MPANDPTKLPYGLKKIQRQVRMEMQVEVDQFLSLMKVVCVEVQVLQSKALNSKAFFNCILIKDDIKNP